MGNYLSRATEEPGTEVPPSQNSLPPVASEQSSDGSSTSRNINAEEIVKYSPYVKVPGDSPFALDQSFREVTTFFPETVSLRSLLYFREIFQEILRFHTPKNSSTPQSDA